MSGCLPQIWGPSIQSEGQAAGKLGLGAPGSEVFLAPRVSPPRTPDLGVMKRNHGSEVGISREQDRETWERRCWEVGPGEPSPAPTASSADPTAPYSTLVPVPPLPKTR